MTEYRPTTGFAPVAGGELYYEMTGIGRPLALIHAGIANCRMWDAQVAAFAPHYRVICYDTRGFGRSRTEAVAFSNRQDLADLLAHLGVQQAALIGVSRGGNIAIDFTLERPEMVTALIPVAAGLGGYTPTRVDPGEEVLFEEMERVAEQGDFHPLNELEIRVFVDGPGQPANRVAAALREQVLTMNALNVNRNEGEPIPQPLDPPAVGRLSEIQAPTLVVVGDLDTVATLEMADRIAEGIAGARKVVFQGAAHMPTMERAAEFNQLVLEFLRDLPA